MKKPKTKKEIDALIDIKLAAEKLDNNECIVWMSFVDIDKPEGQKSLGVIITRCLGPMHATQKTHRLGINPGGEIIMQIGDFGHIAPEDFDTLLDHRQLVEKGYITVN